MTLEATTGGEITIESMNDMFTSDAMQDSVGDGDKDGEAVDTTDTVIDTTGPETPEVAPEEAPVEETPEPLAPEKAVKLKDGDKEVLASREALVDVKINGKVESLPLQEVINRASGAINVDRANAELGRERKYFRDQQEQWQEQVDKVSANMEAILAIESPLEMAEYIADLKGLDSEEIYEKILKFSYDELTRLQEMTPNERAQAKKLRQYDRIQRQQAKQREAWERRQQLDTKRGSTQQMVEAEGFTMSDFQGALNELSEKVRNKEPLGFGLDEAREIDESTIIDYLVLKDTNAKVVTALEAQNKEMVSDEDFVHKIMGAVIKTESLSGKLNAEEVAEFVKHALELEGRAVKESLSRKAPSVATSESTSSNGKEGELDPEEFKDFFESLR